MSDEQEGVGPSDADNGGSQDPGPQFHAMPHNMQTLVYAVGIVDEPDMDEDIAEMLQAARDGRCMTCKAQLGDASLLFVNKNGIVAAYCGGACAQDMAVIGWIQEQHDDIVDRVAFRGGQTPEDT